MGTTDPLGLIGTTPDERVRVEEVVGEGGFGVVYRGRHLGFEESVAIKCLKVPPQLGPEQREDIIRRFKGEARMLHRLSRKTTGIVQALDVGAWDTPTGGWAPYIIMEWLQGTTLEQDLAHRASEGQPPLALEPAVRLLQPAAEALSIAHGHNVAHLDVKPANLFLAVDDDEVTLKVLDFGVAKVFSSSKPLTRAMVTTQGVQAFTPQYAAPEQFETRHGRLGPHTDVFALGLILLELTSGRRALSGDTPLQLYMAAINELSRPSFAMFDVEATPAAEAALRCALAVDVAERFGDAATMWQALADAVGAEPPRGPVAISTVVPREAVEAATMAGTSMQTTGHNRLCTILVAELRGLFAVERRLDAERVAQLTDRSLDAARRAVDELGGTVYELAAGRLVAIFGLGSEGMNAAERAVTAALRARDAVAELRDAHRALQDTGLGLRIGIQTGRIYVSTERTSRVTGTPLTLATEMLAQAEADDVVVGRATQRQIAGQFELQTVDGDATEETTGDSTYRVLGAIKRRDLRSLARSDFLGIATRFVGREGELAMLDEIIDGVIDSEVPQSVLLLGEPGLGKSRILLELVGRLERGGFFVLAASSPSTGVDVSYGLAAALLRTQFHLHEDEPPDVAEAKLRAGARSLARSASRSASRPSLRRRGRSPAIGDVITPLLRVLGLDEGASQTASGAFSDEEHAPSRIAASFAALLQLPQKPIAIVCDDSQWSDPASLALLDELRLRMDQPLLVVCAGQPGVIDRHATWAKLPERRRIELRPLSRRHLEAMIRDRLQRADALPDDLIARIADRSEGNALALVEMLHLLIDAGAIDTTAERWRVEPGKIGEIALPTTVQAIVQARLDRLGNLATDIVCHAAVIGRRFWPGAVATIMERLPVDLEPIFGQVIERELVVPEPSSSFPDERELRFAETSTREVAYEMLATSQRRLLHRRVAEWLEDRGLSDAMSALVAEHYERSGARLDAVECYARAGQHAASLGRPDEAVTLFDRARRIDERSGEDELDLDWDAPVDEALQAPWPDRVRLRFELGDVLRLSGRLDEAEARYEDAKGFIAPEASEPERAGWLGRIAYRQAMLGELRGEIDSSLAALDEALGQARKAGLAEDEAQMLALVAALELRRDDEAASRQACLRGLRVLRGVDRRTPRWREAAERLLRTLGGTLYRRGRYVSAERCYRQALRLIDERAFPHLASRLHNNIAGTRFSMGDVEAARVSFEATVEMAERSGEMVVLMAALANLGEVEHALGHPDIAVDYLDEAVGIGERIGASGDLADVYRNLALARLALGQSEGAFDAADAALALAQTDAGRAYLPHVVPSLVALTEVASPRATALGEQLRACALAHRQAHPDAMAEALRRLAKD